MQDTPSPLKTALLPRALALVVDKAPRPLLLAMLNAAMALVCRRHPSVFERLAPFAGSVVVIDAGLGRNMALHLHNGRATLDIADAATEASANAVIRGAIGSLLDLLEGRLDGDALFFSRQLAVEGDTEVIVALRNAVDGEDIDLIDDFTASFGPFAGLLRRLLGDFDALLTAAVTPPSACSPKEKVPQRNG